EDKKTGFLYISGDSKDLKDKILYALNNTDLCKKIASDAKENAKENFNAENNAIGVYENYKKVLNI
ncbi:MAG: hypothetical protein PHN42_04355, partial [Bacilli bacterium]|nr:hypothetical protein [Bacilli bacterium]